MATNPTNGSIELELGVPEEVTLSNEGVWYFKPQSPNQVIRASLNPSMDNPWSSKDFGGKLPVSVGANGLTIWLEVIELAGAPTCNVFYSNCFGQNFFDLGGGGGGTTYAFTAPLEDQNNNVVLNLANDLQVSSGNLTLNLQNNSDFTNLSSLVQSLTSGVEIVGLIPNTNAQVTANTQLLTDFVQAEKGRAPRGGDIILTTEPNNNPSFVWIFTSNGVWISIGTTGAGIATNTTLGLVKGSNTITIASDGSASVRNVLQLTGNYTVQGSITFNQPLYTVRRIRFTATDSASIAPSTNVTAELYFSDGSIGNACRYNLQMDNIARILSLPQPQSDGEPVRLVDLNNRINILASGTTPTTSNVSSGQIAFVIR